MMRQTKLMGMTMMMIITSRDALGMLQVVRLAHVPSEIQARHGAHMACISASSYSNRRDVCICRTAPLKHASCMPRVQWLGCYCNTRQAACH